MRITEKKKVLRMRITYVYHGFVISQANLRAFKYYYTRKTWQ